jgi:hypothetical protein
MPTLSPKEAKVLSDMSNLLYGWLPGSSPPYQRIYTLADAARFNGLGNYWLGGSKLPAIQQLLESAFKQFKLQPLLLTILPEAIKWRDKKGKPIVREEVEQLNSLLLSLELKIPSLNEQKFLDMFPSSKPQAIAITAILQTKLESLKQRYRLLETNPDPQGRGFEFQDLLFDLFDAYDLDTGKSYRVQGEELDGSFRFQGEIYLFEARWRKEKANKGDFADFLDKIERKSIYTRGLFVSINGFSVDAIGAISIGKPSRFIVMSGNDLETVLRGETNLIELLGTKLRALLTRGQLTYS